MSMYVKNLRFGFLKFFFIFEFWGLLSGEKSLQKSLRIPYCTEPRLEADLGPKSMVLGRQRELSDEPVIQNIRNHPETPFLGM